MNQPATTPETSPPTTSHWILLRGLARESRHWDDFPEKLKQALASVNDNARVDAIDTPGAGRYSEMKSPATIGEITEFVREKFIEIRRKQRDRGEVPSERTRIVAVSMGGMIAADWMQRWPNEIKEVVFLNTSFSGFSKPYQRLRPRAFIHLLGTIRAKTAYDRELRSQKLVSNLEANLERAKQWASFSDERPFTLENFIRQLTAAAGYRAPDEKPNTPILTLFSKNDRMVSADCSRQIVSRWKTDWAEHPTAGHELTLDDADWVIEKTLAWERDLKEIPERPRVGRKID